MMNVTKSFPFDPLHQEPSTFSKPNQPNTFNYEMLFVT